MEKKQKKFNLRVAEDGTTVLLDCHVAIDDLDSLAADISNELEALGIKEPPDKDRLKEQLRHAAGEDPHLVDFVLIEGEPPEKFNLRVSKNCLAVLLDCDVTAGELESLVVAISRELESLHIKDPPDKEQLSDKLRHTALENSHLVDFVLLEGEPPVPPEDGSVDWEGDFFNTGFVTDKKTGRVDYREKAAHKSVKEDTLLGKRILAKKGKNGKDVFGNQIPAKEPMEYYPKTGDNVRFNEAENTYYATVNGRVRFVNNILSVNEVYSVPENVDMKTGNISHTGAVMIKGDVLKDSKVEADGNVEVYGVVEGADIRSGGDLNVHGGIMLDDKTVTVEGGIHAKFIHGGVVEAKNDIVIENEIVNSTVRTLGAVVIPKGRIVGGEVIALKGVYVGQSGTKSYTPTVLIAGENFSVRNKISLKEVKIKKVETELKRLKGIIDALMSDPETLSTGGQEGHVEMQLRIDELEQDLKNLIEEMEDIRAESMGKAKRLIVIEKLIYPKTTLCLGYECLAIKEEQSGPIRAEIVEEKIELSSKTSDTTMEQS